ncbi:hypothetical protein BDV93DRAFT_513290 [Ceratobasidium sp. AG-I]|nr:hypothetical protein BDV93DRAFT_513290 [Ceratobasidium sp. AG-I]
MTSTSYSGIGYADIVSAPTFKSLNGRSLGPKIRILGAALTYKQDPREVVVLKDPVQDVSYLQDLAKEYECVEFIALSESEASETNIIKQAQAILRRCNPGDLFILYLAGHGHQEQTTGYTFLACHNLLNPKLGELHSEDLIKHIREARPAGVSVLQIRDTCKAAPNEKETQLLLSQGDDIMMVLAACGAGEEGWEATAKLPHSLFLSKLVQAGKEFEDGMVKDPSGVRKLVQSFFDIIISPICEGDHTQTAVLAPVKHKSKFIEFIVQLIGHLQEPLFMDDASEE